MRNVDVTQGSPAPLLSVITVVYNAEALIASTLSSITQQTFDSFELIVIDGGSSDGTLEVIDRFRPEIQYLSSAPDKGIYDAMNKGLKVAKGVYVLFINAGDTLFSTETLTEMMRFAPLADVIYGKTMLINQAGMRLGERRLKPPAVLNWRSFLKGMLVSHQAFIARRCLAGDYNLAYSISSDVDWCIRVLKNSKTIVNGHQYIANYLVGGMSRQKTWQAWKERFLVMKNNYGILQAALSHLFIAGRFLIYFSKTRSLD